MAMSSFSNQYSFARQSPLHSLWATGDSFLVENFGQPVSFNLGLDEEHMLAGILAFVLSGV